MSFNPTTDSRVIYCFDYRSTLYSDLGGTTPVTTGAVQSFRDSKAGLLATLAAGTAPTIATSGGNPILQATGATTFCFSLGQPGALVTAINNAITTLSSQSGSNYFTVLMGVSVTGDTILLSKSSGSQYLQYLTPSGATFSEFGWGGSAIDGFNRGPFDGSLVRQVGWSIYPMAAGAYTVWMRAYADGAGTKGTPSPPGAFAVDTSSDIYIGSISNIPGLEAIGGKLAYLLICNSNLSPTEIAQCEAFYRAAYGLADPRAGFGYNVAMLTNSFGEATNLPEALAAQNGIPPANVFNIGYNGATTEQLTSAVYPGEAKDLFAYLTGSKQLVIYAREMTNSLLFDSTGAQIATAMETLWETIRTDNPSLPVVVPTCLPRGTGTPTPTDSIRDAANTAIRAAISGVAGVYLADDAANSTIGADGASNNPTYFGDTTHPTPAGCAIIAGIDGPVIATAASYGRTPIEPSGPTNAASGGFVSLSVSATGGSGSYTYQWYRSTVSGQQGTAISGATAATLTDTGLTIGSTYYYTCVVGDSLDDTPVATGQIAVTVPGPRVPVPIIIGA